MVDVTIATPNPEKVDGDVVLSILPEGKRRISIIEGGMAFPVASKAEEAKTHGIVMANAVIVVLVDAERSERK